MKIQEIAEYFDLPILGEIHPHISFNYHCGIVLDECYNSQLLNFLYDNTIRYYTTVYKDTNKETLSVYFTSVDSYTGIKKRFPSIKEIGLVPPNNIVFIAKKDIKTFYDNLDDSNTSVCGFIDRHLPFDISGLFTYSYAENGYNIHLPTYADYKKLILLLNGHDNFRLYKNYRGKL